MGAARCPACQCAPCQRLTGCPGVATGEGRYRGQGHPWADYLHARMRLLAAWRADGKTAEQCVRDLATDPVQIRLLWMTIDRMPEEYGAAHPTPDAPAAGPMSRAWLIAHHHEDCDVLQPGPQLGPSTKPCNCRGPSTPDAPPTCNALEPTGAIGDDGGPARCSRKPHPEGTMHEGNGLDWYDEPAGTTTKGGV